MKGEDKMTFTEIWNEAYNLFTDGTKSEGKCYNDMQRFLEGCVRDGLLTVEDKCYMVRDIRETANL